MKVKLLNADYGGCGYYRIIWPAENLKKLGVDAEALPGLRPEDIYGKRLKMIAKVFRPLLLFFKDWPVLGKMFIKIDIWLQRFAEKQSDIVVFQRHAETQTFHNAMFLKHLGVKVVFEVDDYLAGIDRLSPARVHYTAEVQERMMKMMMIADAVTVTTDYLKNILSDFNPNIYVLPNSINVSMWNQYYEQRQRIKSKKSDKVIIGWMGSKTHLSDLLEVKDVLFNIIKTNPDVYLKIVGFEELPVLLKKDYEAVKDKVIIEPWKNNMFDYSTAMLEFDIAVAPLKNSAFNKAKSNLKWIEYSALGIPTVATNIETYKCINNGVTGYLTSSNNNPVEWERKLKMLISSVSLRKSIGEAARQDVLENYDLKKNVELWKKAYEQILSRPRLTSEKDDLEVLNTNFLAYAEEKKSA